VRLALSSSYWPTAWPLEGSSGVRLFPGGSTLSLPERPRRRDESCPGPGEPEAAPEPRHRESSKELYWRRSERRADGGHEIRVVSGVDATGEMTLLHYEGIDLELGHVTEEGYRIGAEGRGARAQIAQRRLLRRGEWCVRVETACRLSVGRDGERLVAVVTAFEGEERVATRRWRRRLRREPPGE
jgi:hypothetical protein